MKINFLLLCVLALFAGGCATMSKEECRQADWYLQGVEDATKGYAVDRVVDHGKACARVKVTPNMNEYREGHKKGARLYCVKAKGYSEGRGGNAYNGICPPELEGDFLYAYRDGQELYRIEQAISSRRSLIDSNSSRIENDYDEIARLKGDIVNSDNEKERRYKMRRVDELQMDVNRARDEINRADYELRQLDRDYHRVEEQHFRKGYLR